MHPDRVLVLDADGRVGLACVQSLGTDPGRLVHVAVRRLGSTTEHSRWCHRVHMQPAAADIDAALAWLIELDERFGFSLIIPTTEASLRWLRALPPDDPRRVKAVLASDESLDIALDKHRTWALARELGLPVPAARTFAAAQPAPPPDGAFPRVLKPVRSKVVMDGRLVSLSVAIVRDERERAATLASWLPYTAVQEQDWVPGRGVGVEMLYEHGRLAWHFVHERMHEWPLTGGASTLRRAAGPEPALVEMAQRLLDRLQWHGVAMVEWRRADDGRVHLMEINPRLWGSLPLTIFAGVDMPAGLHALATRRALAPATGWRVGRSARNMTADLQWSVDNARADRGDPLLLTERPWRTALGWLRPLTGREVWDGWSWRDAAVARDEFAALAQRMFRSLGERNRRRAALAQARRRHAALLAAGTLSPTSSLLFLCLGNLCRSPFAEAAARARLPTVGVESAGFLRHDGRPSPPHVVATAQALDLDLSKASARRVTAGQVEAAGVIVCMDLTHLDWMAREFPAALAKTTLLGLFEPDGPAEIRDPYDLSPTATRAIFVQMTKAVDALATRMGR